MCGELVQVVLCCPAHTTIQAAARANGTVTFTVATYDYAEGAMLWYNDIFSKVRRLS